MTTFTVSQLNTRAREALNLAFSPETWVVGEIQGLKQHYKSGHAYFDLVEKSASGRESYLAKVNCAFFQGSITRWRRSLIQQGLGDMQLEDGLEVRLRARVDLYPKEGRYQIIVDYIDPAYTLGALARKRAQTIEQLKLEGLLERNRSLILPRIPLKLGLITSEGSAAYNDFMTVLGRSGYAFEVVLADSHMQGAQTSGEVCRALSLLGARDDLDAIAIVRGGGARTDLVYFDDLAICRGIGRCPVPVITGIGHEIDLSVADLTAWRNFVTPTDTARFFVEQLDAVWQQLDAARGALSMLAAEQLRTEREHIAALGRTLTLIAREQTTELRHELANTAHAFRSALLGRIRRQEALLATRRAEVYAGATQTLKRQRPHLETLAVTTRRAAVHTLERQDARVDALGQTLRALDPEQTLKRGYSITLGPDGRAVAEAAGVHPGERITTITRKGRIHSTVEETT